MNEEPASLLGLFKKLKEDTANLVHDEIALAKTELSEKVLSAWRHLGYLAGGVLIAYGAFLLILQGLSFLLRQLLLDQGMQEGSATLLAFLIVGALVSLLGTVLILKALDALKKQPLRPTETAQSLQEDKQWVRSKVP
jgi:Putative Actinobacterial Holin-X, holin superfamily III